MSGGTSVSLNTLMISDGQLEMLTMVSLMASTQMRRECDKADPRWTDEQIARLELLESAAKECVDVLSKTEAMAEAVKKITERVAAAAGKG